MKKLMFAVAAIAAGAAVADVTSANVVGYEANPMQEMGNVVGAAFIPVGGGKMVDLTTITVTGYDGAFEGSVVASKLTETGATDDEATYSWNDYIDDEGVRQTGWRKGRKWVAAGDVTFQAGLALWTVCDADNYKFQSAGQVPTSKVVVEMQEMGLQVNNATPVNADLTKCIITGYDGAFEGSVVASKLTETGATDDEATYSWNDYIDDEGVRQTGWRKGRKWVVEGDVVLTPGQGLWVVCDADGYNFEIPGVDIK